MFQLKQNRIQEQRDLHGRSTQCGKVHFHSTDNPATGHRVVLVQPGDQVLRLFPSYALSTTMTLFSESSTRRKEEKIQRGNSFFEALAGYFIQCAAILLARILQHAQTPAVNRTMCQEQRSTQIMLTRRCVRCRLLIARLVGSMPLFPKWNVDQRQG